ncbi:hypothetical protein GALMADRAFT_224653 [Galerina marginata CBS 339.88]|uniref:F-box domain-containing protein n=1 Tax=Galerina marginata (strain CBS 339.88) TaxID=685588 RepID=A0A067T7D9_GALM3|nr:hypothetical protein GALMADRAFT_224653 [Galerina marginata CBS 339.88]
MAQLLDLAPELLTKIFVYLPHTDLLRCIQTCRFLFQTITKTLETDYHIHLSVVGMQDNLLSYIPLPVKLDSLGKRETSWAFLNPKFTSTIPVPYNSSGTYELSPTTFFLGMAPNDHSYSTTGLASLLIPYNFQDGVVNSAQWNTTSGLSEDMKILEFGLSVEENDLIACVFGQKDDEDPSITHAVVVLLHHSTKKPHEAAQNSIFHLCNATEDTGRPSLGIEVAGENLAITVVYKDATRAARQAGIHAHLFVFNWKTGKSKTGSAPIPFPIYNSGLVFLREDLLANPDLSTGSIDIYHIPPSSSIPEASEGPAIRLIHSLLLPPLEVDRFLTSVSCRCSPNPTTGSSLPEFMRKDRAYTNDPIEAIILFNFDVFSRDPQAIKSFAMIVHRKALLKLVPAVDEIDSEEPVVGQPWESWGPPVTRWFDAESFNTPYITSVSGSRYVQYAREEKGQRRDTMHVVNFNPAFVNLAIARKFNEASRDTATIEIIGQVEIVSLNGDNDCVEVEGGDAEAEEDRGAAEEECKDAEEGSAVDGAEEEEGERQDAGDEAKGDDVTEDVENICRAEGFFTSDVVGRLPYVRATSKRKWNFDEVFMTEEALLGMNKKVGTHRVGSLTVMYFG